MAKSIEILENTLLKLVVRSGTDSDRKSIILDSGELGYTTDTKRLYVGDGTTSGGILVGNTFNGSRVDVTTGGGNPAVGDLAYDTDNKTLYRLLSSNYTNITNWEAIGGVYTAANNTIRITSTNTVSVCAISANNISRDALGTSMDLSSGRVTLSSTIVTDNIKSISTSLALPSALNINTNTYRFPATTLSANTFLRTDASGNLSWTSINTFLSSASARVTLGSGLTATVNGVPTSSFSLITSSNVNISGLFLPTAHVTFGQAGNITRSVGIVSVVPQSFIEVQPHIQTIYGQPVQPSTSRFDYPGDIYGYLITTTNSISQDNVVVDVTPKNASYYYDFGSYRTFGPTITPYYYWKNDTQLLVTFYVAQVNTLGSIKEPFLTVGYNNIDTRFSVTVYG